MQFRVAKTSDFAIAAARMFRNGNLALPAGNDAWIDYPGPPGTIRQISFSDVERGTFDRQAVRGKPVVVGPTSPVAGDRRPTPTSRGGQMSAPEIEAAAMETALRGFPLGPAAGWVNLLLAVLLAVIAPLAALRLGTFVALAIGVAAAVAFLIG